MSLLNIRELIKRKKENEHLLLAKKRNLKLLSVLLKKKLSPLILLVKKNEAQQLSQLDLLLVLKIFI